MYSRSKIGAKNEKKVGVKEPGKHLAMPEKKQIITIVVKRLFEVGLAAAFEANFGHFTMIRWLELLHWREVGK